MAAPRGSSGSDTDSDSSGEAAARLREAAWDCAAQAAAVRTERRCGGSTKDRLQSAQPSLRREVNGHGDDGNELQTTPEFRAHVAKKLGAMLDSFITVMKDSSESSQTVQQSDSADDGFRLFSSSVPGDSGASPPRPAARRQPSSSSDTDSDLEWQRYQEAAVSATDILKQSAFPALSQNSRQDHSQCDVEHSQKIKKKKKIKGENNVQGKIIDPAEGDQIGRGLPQLVSGNDQPEREDSRYAESSVLAGGVKKKKKKKKKRE
ncbi:protein CUSTOS [Dryobates pubescens]|nr:protein CUSTOS [Dryobates pubescens]